MRKLFIASWLIALISMANATQIGISTHVGLRLDDGDLVASSAAQLAVPSVRDELYWTEAYDQNGKRRTALQLQKYRHAYQNIKKSGACLLLILGYGHPRFVDGLPDSDIEIKAFNEYVQDVLAVLGDTVCMVEIWNEWNIGAGRIGEKMRFGDPVDYARLVTAVSGTIRTAAPAAKILIGSVADGDSLWLSRVLSNVHASDYDGVSVHPYVFGAKKRGVEGLVELIAKFKGAIRAAGASKPIYVTEIGWPNYNGPGGSNELVVAQNLIKSGVVLSHDKDVAGIWWYGLKDKGRDPTQKEHGFGLLDNGGLPKLSAGALRNFNIEIAGCTAIGAARPFVAYDFDCVGRRKSFIFDSAGLGDARNDAILLDMVYGVKVNMKRASEIVSSGGVVLAISRSR